MCVNVNATPQGLTIPNLKETNMAQFRFVLSSPVGEFFSEPLELPSAEDALAAAARGKLGRIVLGVLHRIEQLVDGEWVMV